MMLRMALGVVVGVGLWSGAAGAYTFGNEGRRGQQGAAGQPGRDGVSITLMADGSSQTYDLTGQNGGDGYQGEDGGDARNCQQPVGVSYNVVGADGGSGGAGGPGGRGGHGGAVTVHYTDIAHLRSIHLRGTPGRGGRGSYGGRGGRPCACSFPTWTVGAGDQAQTYYCQMGDYGQTGAAGSKGADGSYGEVRIIGQLNAPASDHKSHTLDFEEMETASLPLSLNLWERRQGARALFAPGSDLADAYVFFAGTLHRTVSFAWKAPRPLSDFAGKRLTVYLENPEPKLALPSGLWARTEIVPESATGRRIVFDAALESKEAFELTLAAAGSGPAMTVEVRDAKQLSEVVATQLTLDYYTLNGSYYYRRFYGKVPDTAITQAAGGLTIALGSLGIQEGYLKKGHRTLIEVRAVRSLGANAAYKTMRIYYTIP